MSLRCPASGERGVAEMPGWVRAYVRYVEIVGRRVGRATMYLVFVMLAVLSWSAISKDFSRPALWTLDVAQWLMVAYFILGGAYSMQLDDHVRMDLVYGRWSVRRKAWFDAITILFLLFYLAILVYGGFNSTIYAITYGEVSPTAWRPKMWPVKVVMLFGIVLMLLQAVATFLRDIATIRGEDLP
jgi:TRAP-type mannitol/chloroaromatic compound transport system permease small subunit